jgi:hypothetical protein
MGFPERPKELELYPLEERLVSYYPEVDNSIKGNVVNVPIDIQPTINSLPRTFDKSGTISVKLKKNINRFLVSKAIRKIERMSFLYGMCFDNRVKKPGLMT